MPAVQPRSFDHLDPCDALSKAALKAHLRLYAGYVEKYNTLAEKLHTLQRRGPAAIADLGSLKGDITIALSAARTMNCTSTAWESRGRSRKGNWPP